WARDTRNDFFMPTLGTYQCLSLESTLPGSTAVLYMINYEFSRDWQLSPAFVPRTGLVLGYGDSFGSVTVRNLCYTPPSLVDTDGDGKSDTWVPGDAPPSPCLPDSSDYRKTVSSSCLPFFENF